jgi:hypothetical protein
MSGGTVAFGRRRIGRDIKQQVTKRFGFGWPGRQLAFELSRANTSGVTLDGFDGGTVRDKFRGVGCEQHIVRPALAAMREALVNAVVSEAQGTLGRVRASRRGLEVVALLYF